ncbi:MAG: hypothetical protein Q9223_006135 [Gallowayella weberi]
MDFQTRHALISFLLNGLEKSHEKYAKRTIPEDLEHLQMFSSDEFELQVWANFLYGPQDGDTTDEDGNRFWFYDGICQIRQLAVHRPSTYRCNFSTNTIRCAAACAFSLRDDEFLEQIELVTRVLYAEASGRYIDCEVTKHDEETVYRLLWPNGSPIETDHEFLEEIQYFAENASFNFCKRHLPQELAAFGCTAEHHFELHQWAQVIKNTWHSGPWISEDKRLFFYKISDKLRSAEYGVRKLRNATAHRERLTFDRKDAEQEKATSSMAERYVEYALEYVRALGDEDVALDIEEVAAETIPILKERYLDWLDIKWCQGKDLQRILDTTRAKSGDGALEGYEFNPIRAMYRRAYRRALHFKSILEPSEDSSPAPEDCVPTAPAGLGGWETYNHDNHDNNNNHNDNLEKVSNSPNAEGQYPSEWEQFPPAGEEEPSSPSDDNGEESQSDTDVDDDNSSPNMTDVDNTDDWWTTCDPQHHHHHHKPSADDDETTTPDNEDDDNTSASDEDEVEDPTKNHDASSSEWPTTHDTEHDVVVADKIGDWDSGAAAEIPDPPPAPNDRDRSNCCEHEYGWAGCRLGRPEVVYPRW